MKVVKNDDKNGHQNIKKSTRKAIKRLDIKINKTKKGDYKK